MKKSTKLGIIVACSAALFSLNSLLFNSEKVEAATSITGTLVPGETVDTGNHTLDSTFQQNRENWTVLSGNSSWWNWDTSGSSYFSNYLWLAREVRYSWAYHVINTAIDFSKPVTISTPYYYDKVPGSLNILAGPTWEWGDAAGFILTPESNSTISQNAPQATGNLLGINGLKNSYFIGRDPWYNIGFDGPKRSLLDENSGQDKIEIRKTDTSGILEQSDTNSISWVEASAPLKFLDTNDLLSNKEYAGETQKMTWSPTIDNKNGTYTGQLSLTSIPDSAHNNGGNYKPVSISRQNVTIAKYMNFGSLAITGKNTALLGEGNTSSKSYFSATRGTANITVNYINKKTGQPINNGTPSTITANIGDVIGVTDGNLNSLDDYDYKAPNFDNYIFTQGDSLTLEIGDDRDKALDIFYIPKSEVASFKSYYVSGTPGTGIIKDSITGLESGLPESSISKTPGYAPMLPETITVEGSYDEQISSVPDILIPNGYKIDHVVGPNRDSYPSIAEAIAANPNFDDLSNNSWANYFSIYLKAKASSTSFMYKYLEGTRPNAPTLPDSLVQNGMTGGVISDPTQTLAELPKGATIQNITGPDGKNYNTLSEAVVADSNKYFSSVPNNFIINVAAAPVSVSIEETPDLDFRTQELKGKPIYSISPQGVLGVSDDTATNKGWNIRANLIQQFTTDRGQSIKGATLSFDKGEVIPATGNTSTPPTTSEFILSENGPVRVANAQANTGQGNWQLKFPNVSLNTHGSALAVNQQYQATIEWDISNVPE